MSSALLSFMLAAAVLGPAPAHAHARPKSRKPMRMTATAYCDKGETEGGIHTRRGIIAADPRVLPIGSTVRVIGLGRNAQTFFVADTGSAVKGRRIDIFMPSCRAAKRFGRKPVIVRPVKVGDGDLKDGDLK
jgi:3D (Asp-Asp-Asp) domain-containing protein